MSKCHDKAGSNSKITVWIPRDVVDICISQARKSYPLETGGAFVGWWSDSKNLVVRGNIDAGPEAYHGKSSFEPDQSWQVQKISEHYLKTEGVETYVGDWHTHPNALSGKPSLRDRLMLRKVANTPQARCNMPLMVIFWGKAEEWKSRLWIGEVRDRFLFWGKLRVYEPDLKLY